MPTTMNFYGTTSSSAGRAGTPTLDLEGFAWEIVRRHPSYVATGASAVTTYPPARHSIVELIEAVPYLNSWGLCFRGKR
ncbi:transcriptional regulator domain-containing protein [Sphingomonas nostoxanthinifaciens]|uniref:transcriptional regulator domain-containing protein n=1 Tax=Sphingomonas nostoxanthinifaciens TaxID=2872652 RepID=UPI0037DA1131